MARRAAKAGAAKKPGGAERGVWVSALVSEALGLMNARKITNLFVVDDGIPVGILHIHDCLRAGVA